MKRKFEERDDTINYYSHTDHDNVNDLVKEHLTSRKLLDDYNDPLFKEKLKDYINSKKVAHAIFSSLELDAQTALDVCEVLQSNTVVKEVKFIDIGIFNTCNDASTGLKNMIINNTTIRVLRIINDNEPYNHNMTTVIAEGLKHNNGLISFAISTNTPNDSQPIIEAVEAHPTLKILECNHLFANKDMHDHPLVTNTNIISLSTCIKDPAVLVQHQNSKWFTKLINASNNLYELDLMCFDSDCSYIIGSALAKMFSKLMSQNNILEKIENVGIDMPYQVKSKLAHNAQQTRKIVDSIGKSNFSYGHKISNKESENLIDLNHVAACNGIYKIGESLLEYKLSDYIPYNSMQKFATIREFSIQYLFHIKGVCKQTRSHSYSSVQKEICKYLSFSGTDGIANTQELSLEEVSERLKCSKKENNNARNTLELLKLANNIISSEQKSKSIISKQEFESFKKSYSDSAHKFNSIESSESSTKCLGDIWMNQVVGELSSLHEAS